MKKLIVLSTILTLIMSTMTFSQTNKSNELLTFQITGFADDSGQVLVQLFRKEDKVPQKPFRQIIAKIVNKTAIAEIDDLTYGEYGAIIVHDQNGNGKIDHRWGIPAEPLGYTNNWHLSLFSGMPTFEKLRFTFSNSQNKYDISMKE